MFIILFKIFIILFKIFIILFLFFKKVYYQTKMVCLSPAAKRPKKQIPTYIWIQELLKTIKSTNPVSTYTKNIFIDDTVESVTLPVETVKATWEKNWLGEKKWLSGGLHHMIKTDLLWKVTLVG